jgi:ribose transport system substrate-binding protein
VAISLATMAAASGAPAADKQVVALVQANEQALYFVQLGQGAEAEANRRGLQLVVFNANNDIAAQNNAVETYTQLKAAGIVVDALDRDGMMPAVRAAAAAGVFVSAVDTILRDGPQIAQVGIDSYAAGKQIGDYFVSYIAANGGSGR